MFMAEGKKKALELEMALKKKAELKFKAERDAIRKRSLYQILAEHFTNAPENRVNSLGFAKIIYDYFMEDTYAAPLWVEHIKKKYHAEDISLDSLSKEPTEILETANFILRVYADDPNDNGITVPDEDNLLEYILEAIHKDSTLINYNALADIVDSERYDNFDYEKNVNTGKGIFSYKRDGYKSRLVKDFYTDSMLAKIDEMSPEYVYHNQNGMYRLMGMIKPSYSSGKGLLKKETILRHFNAKIADKVSKYHEKNLVCENEKTF
ncbi:MAG: hypothetical protein MJ060_01285 [Clostridia bacterium]|nr:hypothetical protein [Clostridia bacterium]